MKNEPPWYQRLGINLLIIFGCLAIWGSQLDTISNAISLITPIATYTITGLSIFLLLVIHFWLKLHPIPFLAHNNMWIKVRRLGVKPTYLIISLIVLVWIPRVLVAACLYVPAFCPPQLKEDQVIELNGRIEEIGMGTPAGQSNTTMVLVVISIRNIGSANSIVENYSATVNVPAKGIFEGKVVHYTGPINFYLSDGTKAVFSSEDAIYEKTLQPIPIGGMAQGILTFTIEGIQAEVAYKAGTVVTVSYEDTRGKSYSIERTMTDVKEKPSYYPGIRPPL